MEPTTHHHTCPLCEAMCGLSTTTSEGRVRIVRGDREHPLSGGFLCPKGASLPALHDDPDRLRRPLVRVGERLVEASWDAAFERIDELVGEYLRAHRETLATYVGNPSAHNLSLMLYGPHLVRAVGTRNVYTSSSVDTNPLLAVHALLYGDSYAIPVPDLERTDHLIVVGGNPLVSNGSIMSAPNIKVRLQEIQARGGRIVVVDPRRTETAAIADEHVFVRPGTDVWLLAAMVRHLLATGAVDRTFVDRWADGVDALREAVEPFSFAAAEARCGVDAATVRRLADELADARRAAVYGRMGTSTQRFGSACSWLIACLNVLTGNLDRPGGVMFPLSASVYRRPRTPASEHRDRWHSRVRRLGELFGELPAVTLAEDILTPGPGRIRGLVTMAGNPAVSVPGSAAMNEALADLELMISIDSYVNETTRHADVILPGDSPFERPHFPFLTRFAVRNVVQWSDPVLPPEDDRPREWEALLRVAASFEQREVVDVAAADDAAFAGRVASEVRDPRSPVHGRDPEEIVRLSGPVRGPERLIDFRFRVGPYGDAYGAVPDGLSIELLRRHPHGVDLGPLQPRLADVIATRSGRIELAHPELAAELARALAAPSPAPGELLLVSRRSLRSNNSWMHNIPKLVSGRPRCTLLIHPDDAAVRDVADGDLVQVRSATGAVVVAAEVTAETMPGVVNLPHGWGHDLPGIRMAVAAASPGVNSNLLGDGALLDGLTSTAVTNGIPVTVEPTAVPDAPAADDQLVGLPQVRR